MKRVSVPLIERENDGWEVPSLIVEAFKVSIEPSVGTANAAKVSLGAHGDTKSLTLGPEGLVNLAGAALSMAHRLDPKSLDILDKFPPAAPVALPNPYKDHDWSDTTNEVSFKSPIPGDKLVISSDTRVGGQKVGYIRAEDGDDDETSVSGFTASQLLDMSSALQSLAGYLMDANGETVTQLESQPDPTEAIQELRDEISIIQGRLKVQEDSNMERARRLGDTNLALAAHASAIADIQKALHASRDAIAHVRNPVIKREELF